MSKLAEMLSSGVGSTQTPDEQLLAASLGIDVTSPLFAAVKADIARGVPMSQIYSTYNQQRNYTNPAQDYSQTLPVSSAGMPSNMANYLNELRDQGLYDSTMQMPAFRGNLIDSGTGRGESGELDFIELGSLLMGAGAIGSALGGGAAAATAADGLTPITVGSSYLPGGVPSVAAAAEGAFGGSIPGMAAMPAPAAAPGAIGGATPASDGGTAFGSGSDWLSRIRLPNLQQKREPQPIPYIPMTHQQAQSLAPQSMSGMLRRNDPRTTAILQALLNA